MNSFEISHIARVEGIGVHVNDRNVSILCARCATAVTLSAYATL